MKSARRTVSSSFSRRPSLSQPPLTSALLEPTTVTTCCPGFEPGAVEHRHIRAGGADHHVGIPHHLARRFDRNELRVDQRRQALAKILPVVRVAAENLVGLDRTLVLQRQDLVQRLAAGAEDARDLGILARQMAEADAAGRRRAQRHQAGKADALLA